MCRQLPCGTIPISAGHHRVDAAIATGIGTADLFVSQDMDDVAMVRV